MEPKSLRGGIDVGSTTVKVVIMDENNDSVYQTYQRHFSDVKKASEKVLREAAEAVGLDTPISFTITGSGGMGLAIDRAAELAGVKPADVAVRSVSKLGFLSQFRPAESSEQIATSVSLPSRRLDLDGVIEAAAARLGLVATGALSMPFGIELHAGQGR